MHKTATGAMLLGMVFYVFGFYGATCYSTYVLPDRWGDEVFRQRAKFQFQRWRPDCWFFGTVVMTRNLVIAFAGVASSEARSQFMYTVSVLQIGAFLVAKLQPWRAIVLNSYDVITSFILCLLCIVGIVFISLQKEIAIYERHVPDFERDEEYSDKQIQLFDFGSAFLV